MNTHWTDRELTLSYTEFDEIDDIARMLAKPSVCEHVFFGPNTDEETRSYFAPLVGAMRVSLDRGELPDSHCFTIRHNGQAFVGQCAILAVMYGPGNYIIGYQLDEPWWRRGYGTRACEFLVWYGFAVLGAHRLSADCLGSNLGSTKILENAGFQREATQRQYYRTRGKVHDNLLFRLLRSELTLDLDELGARFQPVAD